MKLYILILLLLAGINIPAFATEWHVALNGNDYDYSSGYSPNKKGTGTIENPWTLQFALSNPKAPDGNEKWIKPGDVIWIHEGVYKGYFEHKKFILTPKDTVNCRIKNCDPLHQTEFDIPKGYTSFLEGDSAHPIIVRAWKEGKVTLDGEDFLDKLKYWECYYCPVKAHSSQTVPEQILWVKGKFVTFWGFEITTSNTPKMNIYRKQRNYIVQDSSSYFKNGEGVLMQARGIKLIDLVIYATAQVAIGDFSANKMSEVQGCIIFNNGYSTKTSGWGHGFYSANEDRGWKKYYNNIVFNQIGIGIKIFLNDRKQGTVRNFDVEDNISFNNGVLYSTDPNVTTEPGNPNIHTGGHSNKDHIIIKNNHFYRNLDLDDPGNSSNNVNAQLFASVSLDTLSHYTVENNYFIGGMANLEVNNIRESSIQNNYFLSCTSLDNGRRLTSPLSCKYSDFFVPSGSSSIPQYDVRDLNLTWDHNTYLYPMKGTAYTKGEAKPFCFQYKNPDTAAMRKKPILTILFNKEQWQGYDIDKNSVFYPISDTKEKQPFINYVYISDNDKNEYNPGRKHIVIYNLFGNLDVDNYKFDLTGDLEKYIQEGSSYVLKDVQNYHSANPEAQGVFKKNTKIFANLSPGQEVEIPKMKDGSLPAGMRVPRHSCPEFIVYTVDFFPYEVSVKKENTGNGKIKLIATVKPKGQYFNIEKFEYKWENASVNTTDANEITVDENNIRNITLVVTDVQTGTSIRKSL